MPYAFSNSARTGTGAGSSAGTPRCPTITEPTPASIAARNGTSSTASSRSRPASSRGSARCESTWVSPCPGKCFAVASSPARWIPRITAWPYRATSCGSLPKLRTLITGLRGSTFTSTTGARTWFTPTARASRAVIFPCSSASPRSPAAATAIAGGHHVTSASRIPTPASKSALTSSGVSATSCSLAFSQAVSKTFDANQITPPAPLSRTCRTSSAHAADRSFMNLPRAGMTKSWPKGVMLRCSAAQLLSTPAPGSAAHGRGKLSS